MKNKKDTKGVPFEITLNVYYYIDDDGYFVIRFNGPDYSYNTVGPK